MQGRPVNELLDVPVERPTVDQLKIEVGRTKKDRVVTRLTGDHGKDGQLDSVDEAARYRPSNPASARSSRVSRRPGGSSPLNNRRMAELLTSSVL